MRLSDGFPQDSEKSVRRFSRTYLGADSKKRAFEGGGLAQTLGLISVQLQEEDGQETIVVRNTDTGKATITPQEPEGREGDTQVGARRRRHHTQMGIRRWS